VDERWKRRFTAPEIRSVRWADASPDRLAVVSTEGGTIGAWAWDHASGHRRRVSGPSVGTEEAFVTPGGRGVVWWEDLLGDERGRWMVTPFDGGPSHPLLPDVPHAWAAGLSFGGQSVAVGCSTEDEYAVWVGPIDEAPAPASAAATADEAPVDATAPADEAPAPATAPASARAPARVVYRHERPAGVGTEWPQGGGGLSADGRLLCLRHAERSDIAHPALRIVDATTGAAFGELLDPGRTIAPLAWSPVVGDARLLLVRELGDRSRPWIWDPESGDLAEVPVDLPGDVARAWWYPNGRSLLLHHEFDAVAGLHRLDLAGGALETIVAPGGTIEDAGVRPDGAVWYRYEDGATPPSWRRPSDGAAVLALADDPAPAGRRWKAIWFENPAGQQIQGWLLRPPGRAPYPTILNAHGGPDWHVSDLWDPAAQAYADHGFAVLSVNYRGSTGFGAAFREALRGNIGFPESEDLLAGLDHLVGLGIADPGRAFFEGWSWGGYLATLNAGLHPERWRGVTAGIPTGDLVAAHYECGPAIRAWDVATMGGDPMDLPELYHERNPMTYVERVAAPMLIIAGEHDVRCPLGQVMVYAHALRRLGKPVELHVYRGGHHANRVEERIRHVELVLDFFGRCLEGA
jgi:dipeptidyl aminopeptidase/acylaminoacyl peptidase